MRKSRFSDQQIALASQQVEHVASVSEVCRKLGISEQTLLSLEEEVRPDPDHTRSVQRECRADYPARASR